MNNKKLVNVVVWLNVLFIILAICTEIYLVAFEEFSLLNVLYGCVDFILLVEAFLYLVTGRKKSSAIYFKIFSIIYATRIMVGAAFSGSIMTTYQAENVPAFSGVVANILTVLPIAPAVVIAACKDLGRKKSFALVGILYAIYIIEFLMALIRPLGYITNFDNTVFLYVARPGLLALLTSLLGIMVVEKYQDKASRNTD